jgi:hypothetical protein
VERKRMPPPACASGSVSACANLSFLWVMLTRP